MDVNGLRFSLISSGADFGLSDATPDTQRAQHLALSESSGHLRLASEQPPPSVTENEIFARGMITQPSPVADPLGGFAWWNAADQSIHASGFAEGSIQVPLSAGSTLGAASDLMLGEDDVVYFARGGTVIWHDLRGRWDDCETAHDHLKADLLAPAPGGGGWAFDRTNRRLMRIRGTPLRFADLRKADDKSFAPVVPNRNPPRLTAVPRSAIEDRFDVVAMVSSAGGRLALLAWETGADAAVFLFEKSGFAEHGRLAGLRFPFSLAWTGEDRLAVIASDGSSPARQAFVYSVAGPHVPGRPLAPEGRIYRLLEPWSGGFCNALADVPRYLSAAPGENIPTSVRSLHPLSGTLYAREGTVLIGPIDSGAAGSVWHRIYAEAALGDESAIDLQLRSDDSPAIPPLPKDLSDGDWALHRILPHRRDDTPAGTPVAAWLAGSSEIPNAPPMLQCAPKIGKAGLFTLLVQYPGLKVRRIAGRYLWIALTMRGNSQCSPELAALRIYAGRRSWRDNYLPHFYSETLSGSDAAEPGPATSRDFMERFLHAYEGALTELEGRIAASWELTDPATTPEPALPWLGQWIGISPTKGEAASRMRQRLLAAPYTARLNGTLGGLLAALELATGGQLVSGRTDPARPLPSVGRLAIARAEDFAVRGLMLSSDSQGNCLFLTGGSVTKGDIVALEGFRLRRTFATIIGADLADETDPLTLGAARSGNSFVGDTLILGEAARAELLALYGPQIDAARSDTAAVAQFYSRLAFQVMVLVRGVSDDAEFKRLTDVARAEVPAHVEAHVQHARNPLIVGAASLVGVDTYLAAAEPFERVQLGETVIGEGDYFAGWGGLDSRADAPVPTAPTASADGPSAVWVGNGFTLSAVASRAANQARIERYIWTWET